MIRHDVAAAIDTLRSAPPRVHVMVPAVSQPLVANVLSALCVDVSMTMDPEQAAVMAVNSDSVCINLGMLEGHRSDTTRAMAGTGRPFVLDPVKVDRVPARLALARELLGANPLLVKGNRGEMDALGDLPGGAVGVVTGKIDTVGARPPTRLANGSPILTQVTGTGCATGALMAALLPTSTAPRVAAAAALSVMNIAAERAAPLSAGPGSFAAALIDHIACLTGSEVAASMRLPRPDLDLSVYLVIGPDYPDPIGIAQAAVAGGVTLIQWRDKAGSTADQVAAVRALVAAVDVPVLVNDRADVALAAGAAGLHVGHGDLTAEEARSLMGDDKIVGVTVHNAEEAMRVCEADIDYASIGAVFPTSSKVNPAAPIGIDGFKALASVLRETRELPLCAIAGITPERAALLRDAGADGVAVMSVIAGAADPRHAASALQSVMRGAPQ